MDKKESFYFIRHGETEWNRTGFFQGTNDIPLNRTGEVQALRACEKLKNLSISSILTSPLKRAVQTASIIHKELELSIPNQIVDELKETNSMEIIKYYMKLKGVKDLPSFEKLIHSDETKDESTQKISSFLLGRQKEFTEGEILIVGHGFTFSTLVEYLDLDQIWLPNCGLVRIEMSSEKNSLEVL